MRIYTSRYQNAGGVVASEAAPIRITAGHPRFRLGFELAGTVKELAPDRAWFGDPNFETMYRAKLYDVGVDQIRKLLAKHGDRVVLLCFENVNAGETCHRRMFAEWWEEETGERVDELADGAAPEKKVLPASENVKKKADRMLSEGKVRKIRDDKVVVTGDSGIEYVVEIEGEDNEPVSCTCRTGQSSPWIICSHRLAAFRLLTGAIATLF